MLELRAHQYTILHIKIIEGLIPIHVWFPSWYQRSSYRHLSIANNHINDMKYGKIEILVHNLVKLSLKDTRLLINIDLPLETTNFRPWCNFRILFLLYIRNQYILNLNTRSRICTTFSTMLKFESVIIIRLSVYALTLSHTQYQI